MKDSRSANNEKRNSAWESFKWQLRIDHYVIIYSLLFFAVLILMGLEQEGKISHSVSSFLRTLITPFALLFNVLSTRVLLLRIIKRKLPGARTKWSVLHSRSLGNFIGYIFSKIIFGIEDSKVKKFIYASVLLITYTLPGILILLTIWWYSSQ